MEQKINVRMSTSNPSTAESSDTRISELLEAGYGTNKLSNEPQSLSRLSSSVRIFGHADALIHGPNSGGDGAGSTDCKTLIDSLVGKQFYDRSSEYWEDFVNVHGTNVASSESYPDGSFALSSTSGACKFVKDEKQPSVITNTGCHSFEPSPDIPPLDTCCGTNRKRQLGLGGGESASFTPATAGPRPRLEASPNFLIDPNTSEQLPAPGQVMDDSRCALSGKAATNVDARQLTTYKNEAPRWQTSQAELQYWCQSAGASENPFIHGSYDGIQSQTVAQRNPSPFSAFPGMPSQRLCVICSDEASGCHYGVLTCGSCKVFFKRAVEVRNAVHKNMKNMNDKEMKTPKEELHYLCAGRNDCIVDKIRRKNCPACRLRKCYQAGMLLGGRKLKRFGALKALSMAPSLMFQSHLAMSNDSQALTSMSCIPGIRDVQFAPQITSILENIEPETVYAGYDNMQPDVPHLLLTSLNRLCEKQLLWIVKWSKSLPGFGNLHISDQMTLIQYSWMNLMVFSLGWRSFQNVTSEYLYFAPDLVLSQEQMRRSPIYDICLAIQFIPQEFTNLQVTREEFLCMKAIILLNTVPLEGLKSQAAFEEMRRNYIRELTKAIHMKDKGLVASSQRFYHLTKLMDALHDIVKKVNLFCLSTFIQAESMKVEFPEMMSEVISSQLPKVLAGMVRPLLFHTK